MPAFGSPFSGLANDRKLTHEELVRAIRFMVAGEYEATQLYMQLGDLENALFGSVEASWISPFHTTILPAECLILVLKPSERVLKILQIKIWPIFIPDIEIRINRLHREKTAQSVRSSPAYNQIKT